MKKRLSFKSFWAFYICLLVFLFDAGVCAFAVSLPHINKSKIRVVVAPGKKEFGEITLDNPTEEARYVRAYLQDWYYLPRGDGSKEFVPPNTLDHSCASWINFSPAEITIPPFGKQTVSYSIAAPADKKGGYCAVLFFETSVANAKHASPVENKLQTGLSVNVRIASLFYVEVEGTVKRSAKIDNPVVTKEESSGKMLLQLDLENNGNTDMTTGGNFSIIDKQGVVYARGEFQDAYTLSGDKVKLKADWKEVIPKGSYDLILTFNLGKALEEAGMGKGEVVVKEATLEIGADGAVTKVGELK